VAADVLMQWKVFPRLMTIMFCLMAWRCAEWFMNLSDPSAIQAGFVSVVMGAMTGAFAIWMGSESKR